jgi:phage portal protein BeeE
VFIKNKQLVVPKDQKPPNIHLPNYYYVVFQLSKFLYRKGDNSLISINPENFEQELEQFMRAILASKILTGESNVLKSWEKNPESKGLYGKFDSEVIN